MAKKSASKVATMIDRIAQAIAEADGAEVPPVTSGLLWRRWNLSQSRPKP
jgi:hypothetical protein